MNLIVTEGTLIALLAVVVSRGNSGIPLSLWIAGVAAALLVPLLFYPFSKTLWSAIDLAMRSTMGESFDGSGAQIGFINRARNRGSGRRIDGSLVESNHPETANSNSNNSTTNTSTGSP